MVDVIKKTFECTSFRRLRNNDVVNLERSLKVDSRVEGHFVLWHIDVSRNIYFVEKNFHPFIDIEILPQDKEYIVPRGSVAVAGISLTVGEIQEKNMRVYLIPHTLKNTNLKFRKRNDYVNIEFDALGKYARRKTNDKKRTPITGDLLKDKGFV